MPWRREPQPSNYDEMDKNKMTSWLCQQCGSDYGDPLQARTCEASDRLRKNAEGHDV